MEIDLHIHTTESDGTYTPEKVVKMAKKYNLKAISITDHDTIDGLLEGKMTAVEMGIEFVNGIEISTNINNRDIHILGYFLNIEDANFLSELNELKIQRNIRNEKILKKLELFGIEIEREKLIKMAPGKILSRVHIANYLVEYGFASSNDEAFGTYIGDKGCAHVPKENFYPQRAVKMIYDNRGLASLAHPNLISKDFGVVENLIKELKNYGLGAIETEYPSFTAKEKRKYRKIAEKYSLLMTGGSDFHGENKMGINIGSTGLDEKHFLLLKDKT
ncbi:MAG: PHP domain-containing protein [Fusobacteriaceae bacterium]|jgi:predicted metal-dependent phosphoesterase TrpH|nr:PHP domain-containing protein [Fusobacteriaceae bacterium]